MIQQVMTNPGEIIFREVPVPEVGDDQVLVKIMNIGICGSDIHVYHGKHPFTKYPVTQGHEVSGEITELGKNVTGFQVGQKVTIEPQVYCGHCYPCRHGKYNLCEELKVMGFQTTGTASEYFAVDASKVTPIPEEMSYEEGASGSCCSRSETDGRCEGDEYCCSWCRPHWKSGGTECQRNGRCEGYDHGCQ